MLDIHNVRPVDDTWAGQATVSVASGGTTVVVPVSVVCRSNQGD